MSLFRRRLNRLLDLLVFLVVGGARRPLAAVGLNPLHQALVIAVLKRRGLFDADYYLQQNDDVANARTPALFHYVKYGDLEGRWPMPLFDPAYYAQQVGLDSSRRTNRLLHYHYIGRHKGISPSPWIDLGYYLANNKDVARAGMDPLRHFVRWGGQEGRAPSPRFDSAYYLANNSEVREWKQNPLVHYLLQGQYEGRSPLPNGLVPQSPPTAIRPAPSDWMGISAPSGSPAIIDVIIPVYGGAAVTLRCIHSVLMATPATPYELVVINDASPDLDLVEELESLSQRGFFRLIHNQQNEGFVKTANLGLRLHPDRDIVLLNSDTEVYHDWLDRLRGVVLREERVGTVTPLSNNATICSYPNFAQDNPYPLEVGYETVDALTRTVNVAAVVAAPTGIGFCLYLNRACLDEIGSFDEDAFGRGYGEENDLCQRAIRRGWRNLIACDVFVRHWGAESFQGERASRIKAALATIDRLHPRYLSDVKDFIRRDPLASARGRLDLARLALHRQKENVLLVTHSRGGGTERHVAEDCARLRSIGKGVYVLRPDPDGVHVILNHPDVTVLPNMSRLRLSDRMQLTGLLAALEISELHIHHLIDFPRDAITDIPALATAIGIPYRFIVHDYTSICPRVNLVDAAGVYCGEPAKHADCDACLIRSGSEFGRVRTGEWRARYRLLLSRSEAVIVPDEDVAKRLARYFPNSPIEIQPHEDPGHFVRGMVHAHLEPDQPLRIAVLGAIGKIKGYDVLLACARDARRRGLPLEFILFGYSLNDQVLRREGVTVTGRYIDAEADEGLAELAPHGVWLPYVWPETYSYTLSIALDYGHPIFAFDLGAIGNRLRQLGATEHLLPLTLACDPKRLNEHFVAYRDWLLFTIPMCSNADSVEAATGSTNRGADRSTIGPSSSSRYRMMLETGSKSVAGCDRLGT